MAETLVPVRYKCGHIYNVVSPGESDPSGDLTAVYKGEPLETEWAGKCWLCGDLWKTQVPESVTEELHRAKYGERIQTDAPAA